MVGSPGCGIAFRSWPLLGLFLSLVLLPGCGKDDSGGGDWGLPTRRPNLVFYLVDTLRADHLGCYGYARKTSPVIDGLAGQSVLFENLHAQSNWTQPSVGSIITSLPPLVFKTFTRSLPEGLDTLAEVLKRAGYRTAGFTTTVAVSAEFGFGQGFDVYQESGAQLDRGEKARREGSVFDADTLNAMAFPWLRKLSREEPFFLYMHSVDPHVPYTPPEAFDRFSPDYRGTIDGQVATIQAIKKRDIPIDQADRERIIALYDGEILFNDHEIGRLVDELRVLGVLDRTLLVILSDHGEELYDRGKVSSGHGHMNLFSELTHIPLIMRLPGRIPAGKRVPNLLSGMDIMPTILELLGVDVPKHLMGRSLLPLIRGEGPEQPHPAETFAFRAKEINDLASVRTPDRLYLGYPLKPNRLFDLTKGEGGRGAIDLKSLTQERMKRWARKMKGYIHAVRDLSLRHMVDDETDLPEGIRLRLEALGYLK